RRNLWTHWVERRNDNPAHATSPRNQNGAYGMSRAPRVTSHRSNSRIGSQNTLTVGERPHKTLIGTLKSCGFTPARSSGNPQQNMITRKYPPPRNTLARMANMVERSVVRACREQ